MKHSNQPQKALVIALAILVTILSLLAWGATMIANREYHTYYKSIKGLAPVAIEQYWIWIGSVISAIVWFTVRFIDVRLLSFIQNGYLKLMVRNSRELMDSLTLVLSVGSWLQLRMDYLTVSPPIFSSGQFKHISLTRS